ncbi:MAG TPA: LysR substrate-binding domain-containing protein [Streptosporangiaceae bacterium]|nr:LysR substrate-binding domain-containing protein [Streptosporangiaceae bacterium]
MAVTLTQIRAFLAIKDTGSVHAAASQLLVSQPSVSAAAAALARELGVALFERHGRGVRLTAAGAAFAPYAAQLLGLLEQGREAAREAASPEASVVRLVAVNTAGEYLVPPLLQAYRELHPGVRVMLEVGNRATVFERLETHRADIGIGGRPPGGRLRGFPLLDNSLVVVGKELPADLAATPWLLRGEGSGTRRATERLLLDLELDSPELLTLGSNGAIKQALAVGLGVTLISLHAVARELREGLLVQIPVTGTPLRRPWHVLFPPGGPPRPAVRAFSDFLRSDLARQSIEQAL